MSQKTDSRNLYPVFKSFKVKWHKATDYVTGSLNFDECINGNCADGEGVRLMMDKSETNYGNYTLYGTLFKGLFSEAGNRFKGKVYKLKLPGQGVKKEKELRVSNELDLTSEAALSPYFIGEGDYYVGPQHWNHGWDGEITAAPWLEKTIPGSVLHKMNFSKGGISWMDLSMPAHKKISRYSGHTFVSGDLLFGKAQLKNGDVYEGFFLRHYFHGPGRLTTPSGKIKQGIWQLDSLLQSTEVEFPSALLQPTGTRPARFKLTQINSLELAKYDSSEFYGQLENNEAKGWGLWKVSFSRYGRDTKGWIYGKWNHNQLDGPGVFVVTPGVHNLAYNSGNNNDRDNYFFYVAGLFAKGELLYGTSFTANYSKYINRERSQHEVQELNFGDEVLYTGNFRNGLPSGCGMQMGTSLSKYYEKPPVYRLKEGNFSNNEVYGFYFENDTARKRDFAHLKYTHPYAITDEVIRKVEADNMFCFEEIKKFKPQFIAELKKKLPGDVAVKEDKQPVPVYSDAFAHLKKEVAVHLTPADWAKVDWDALGIKYEDDYTSREKVTFYETVSADVRKYLNETYTKNGATYKRYTRTSNASKNWKGVANVQVQGKKTSFVILHYCERAGTDAKAYVKLEYEGKKLENNSFVSGGKCSMVTQCSANICKTECKGVIELEKYQNRTYPLELIHEGRWDLAREFWIILRDESESN